MPVKHGILALLAEQPSHGYQLKVDFEERTGGTWQLNIGQVYTTLQRLERDGLVEQLGVDAHDPERRTVALTSAGRAALDTWYATPVTHAPPPRDELVIKVLLAVAEPGGRVDEVIRRQRTATVEHLQALTRRKRDADPARDLGLLLHLDALILKAEAEVRWLDTCEARLRQHPPPADPAGTGRRPAPGPRAPNDITPAGPTAGTTSPSPTSSSAISPSPTPDEHDRTMRPEDRVGGGTR